MIFNVPNEEEIKEVKEEVNELNGQLNNFSFRVKDGKKQVSSDGINWDFFNQSPLAEFEKYDGLYTQSGLSIVSNRCTLVSGGYYVDGNHCYVKMRVKNLTSNLSNSVLIQGFPFPEEEKKYYAGITMQNEDYNSLPLIIEKENGQTFLSTVPTLNPVWIYNSNEYDVYIKYPIL